MADSPPNSPNAFPKELPPEIELLLPDDSHREVAKITYRLFSDQEFRDHFYSDPATALVLRGYSSDAKTISSLYNMDRQLLDQMVQNWRDISLRSQAIKVPDPSSPQAIIALAAVALAAAYFAGAVTAHYLAHTLTSAMNHQEDADI